MLNLDITAVDVGAGYVCVTFACGKCRVWVNACAGRSTGTISATQGCGPHTDMLLHMLFAAAKDDEFATSLWRALVKRALASGAGTVH